MRISINGDPREVPDGATVSEVLQLLNIRRDAIAVEVNREIVPRARHESSALREGDAVEIVTFVGGG